MTEKNCDGPLDELIELSEGFLKRLARERKCPLCMTSLYVREPGEQITNGAHNFCLLANASGHIVQACRCEPENDSLSDRELAVLCYARFKERLEHS